MHVSNFGGIVDQNFTPLEQAKRPRTALAGPYGHPLHPIIVTVPIGAWLSSFIFYLFAIFGDNKSAYIQGAQLLIAIGVIAAVIAAVFGLIDLLRVESKTRARKIGLTHMVINLIVVALFIISFIIQSLSDYGDVNVAAFVIIIIGLALLAVSGWLGGKLVFHYGVRVATEETQLEGFK